MSPSSASDDSSAAPVPVAAARARIVGALPRHTSRLVLRELTLPDIEAVHAYRSLPEVTRYLGHPPLDPDGTRDLVHRWLGDPAALSVALELGGEVIGDVRLWFRRSSAMSPAVTEEVDAGLGYALHPDHQRRGLATEAVGEVVQLVLDAGGVRRIPPACSRRPGPRRRCCAAWGSTWTGWTARRCWHPRAGSGGTTSAGPCSRATGEPPSPITWLFPGAHNLGPTLCRGDNARRGKSPAQR